jgi:hypothetical protein
MATPDHIVCCPKYWAEKRVIALIELIPKVLPDSAKPEDPQFVQTAFVEQLTRRLVQPDLLNGLPQALCTTGHNRLDSIQLGAVLTPVISASPMAQPHPDVSRKPANRILGLIPSCTIRRQ